MCRLRGKSAQVTSPTADERSVIIDEVEKLIGEALVEVFRTSLDFDVRQDENLELNNNGEPQVAGSVGFVGKASGVIYIYTTVRFAREMTCQLLGLSDGEIDGNEMINDALGEVANMVVGLMKSRLADRNIPLSLTVPSIVRGNNFTIEQVSTAERRVLLFGCKNTHLLIELMVKE